MNNSSRAYSYLIKILSARDYSEHRLREKMREKKYPANEIEEAINEIKTRGYLREDSYTEARIKAFMHKGYSPNYIQQKLAQEHLTVTISLIDEVFAEYHESVDAQIERLVRKKMHGKTEFDYDGMSKILRYLISKGHDYGAAKKSLQQILKNEEPLPDYSL